MIKKKSIYIETTIPCFYHEIRMEPEMVARKNWTRQWWDTERYNFNLYTSEAVIQELNSGEYPIKNEALQLIDEIDLLEIDEDIQNIVDIYLSNHVMPNNRLGDALHLALASYYKCEFLLTWNCVHIANANKYRHIKIVNEKIGIYNPTIVTPIELSQDIES